MTQDPMKQIAVRFPEEMLVEIDAVISGRLDRPDRASVIRELIAEALQTRKARK